MSPSHQWYGSSRRGVLLRADRGRGRAVRAKGGLAHPLMLIGKPAARWDHVPARIASVIVNVLGQASVLPEDFWPGLMHATIFGASAS